MSKVSIEGNQLGSGTFTIASPNSNSNRTLNLPDSSGTVVVTGGAQTIEFAAGTVSAPSITTTGDTNTGIFFPASDTIAFAEGGAEAVRINSSGNVGIGTSSPAYKVDAQGGLVRSQNSGGTNNGYLLTTNSSNAAARNWAVLSNSNAFGDFVIRQGNSLSSDPVSGTDRMVIGSNGNVSVNSTDTSYAKFVSRGTGSYAVIASDPTQSVMSYNEGDANNTTDVFFVGRGGTDYSTFGGTNRIIIWSNGNIVNTNNSYGPMSDIKLKQDIVDAGSQWDDLKAVRIRKFRFKDDADGLLQIGVIAQELEEVSPGLVSNHPDFENVEVPVLDGEGNPVLDDEGNPQVTKEQRETGEVTKSVKATVLYMKAVKALQEAMERIEALETNNAALEARITAIENGAE